MSSLSFNKLSHSILNRTYIKNFYKQKNADEEQNDVNSELFATRMNASLEVEKDVGLEKILFFLNTATPQQKIKLYNYLSFLVLLLRPSYEGQDCQKYLTFENIKKDLHNIFYLPQKDALFDLKNMPLLVLALCVHTNSWAKNGTADTKRLGRIKSVILGQLDQNSQKNLGNNMAIKKHIDVCVAANIDLVYLTSTLTAFCFMNEEQRENFITEGIILFCNSKSSYKTIEGVLSYCFFQICVSKNFHFEWDILPGFIKNCLKSENDQVKGLFRIACSLQCFGQINNEDIKQDQGNLCLTDYDQNLFLKNIIGKVYSPHTFDSIGKILAQIQWTSSDAVTQLLDLILKSFKQKAGENKYPQKELLKPVFESLLKSQNTLWKTEHMEAILALLYRCQSVFIFADLPKNLQDKLNKSKQSKAYLSIDFQMCRGFGYFGQVELNKFESEQNSIVTDFQDFLIKNMDKLVYSINGPWGQNPRTPEVLCKILARIKWTSSDAVTQLLALILKSFKQKAGENKYPQKELLKPVFESLLRSANTSWKPEHMGAILDLLYRCQSVFIFAALPKNLRDMLNKSKQSKAYLSIDFQMCRGFGYFGQDEQNKFESEQNSIVTDFQDFLIKNMDKLVYSINGPWGQNPRTPEVLCKILARIQWTSADAVTQLLDIILKSFKQKVGENKYPQKELLKPVFEILLKSNHTAWTEKNVAKLAETLYHSQSIIEFHSLSNNLKKKLNNLGEVNEQTIGTWLSIALGYLGQEAQQNLIKNPHSFPVNQNYQNEFLQYIVAGVYSPNGDLGQNPQTMDAVCIFLERINWTTEATQKTLLQLIEDAQKDGSLLHPYKERLKAVLEKLVCRSPQWASEDIAQRILTALETYQCDISERTVSRSLKLFWANSETGTCIKYHCLRAKGFFGEAERRLFVRNMAESEFRLDHLKEDVKSSFLLEFSHLVSSNPVNVHDVEIYTHLFQHMKWDASEYNALLDFFDRLIFPMSYEEELRKYLSILFYCLYFSASNSPEKTKLTGLLWNKIFHHVHLFSLLNCVIIYQFEFFHEIFSILLNCFSEKIALPLTELLREFYVKEWHILFKKYELLKNLHHLHSSFRLQTEAQKRQLYALDPAYKEGVDKFVAATNYANKFVEENYLLDKFFPDEDYKYFVVGDGYIITLPKETTEAELAHLNSNSSNFSEQGKILKKFQVLKLVEQNDVESHAKHWETRDVGLEDLGVEESFPLPLRTIISNYKKSSINLSNKLAKFLVDLVRDRLTNEVDKAHFKEYCQDKIKVLEYNVKNGPDKIISEVKLKQYKKIDFDNMEQFFKKIESFLLVLFKSPLQKSMNSEFEDRLVFELILNFSLSKCFNNGILSEEFFTKFKENCPVDKTQFIMACAIKLGYASSAYGFGWHRTYKNGDVILEDSNESVESIRLMAGHLLQHFKDEYVKKGESYLNNRQDIFPLLCENKIANLSTADRLLRESTCAVLILDKVFDDSAVQDVMCSVFG